MSSVSEAVDKVNQGLENIGVDDIRENLKNLLDFKQYISNQIPVFWI